MGIPIKHPLSDILTVNSLDRMLSFFQGQANRPFVGDTFYQGDNMPNIFFVDSGVGANTNDGRDPRTPLATLAQAMSAVTANRGDIIYLLPGHSETLTASLSLAVAGVTIIGLGAGAARPTFVVGDAVGEAITLDAAPIWIENCIFICGTDAQTNIVRILSTDCMIKDCDFREVLTTKQPLTCLDITGGAANATDRSKVYGCRFLVPTAGDGDRAIELGEVADGIEIVGCVVFGNFDDACIHNVTGKVLTNLLISDCILTNTLTGQHSIELVSACTGNLVRNMYNNDLTQQTGADTGSCASFECFHCDTIDVSAIISPVLT